MPLTRATLIGMNSTDCWIHAIVDLVYQPILREATPFHCSKPPAGALDQTRRYDA